MEAVKVTVPRVTQSAPGCSMTPLVSVNPMSDGEVGPAVFHEILVAVLPHLAFLLTLRSAPPFLALQA